MKKRYFEKSLVALATGCTLPLVALATGWALLLAGCEKQEAGVSEESMGAAINQYLAKTGDLCLDLNKWPVEVSEHESNMESKLPHGLARRMVTLKSLGLVTETPGEVDQLAAGKPTGRKFKVRYFHLTDEGKKFFRPDVVQHPATSGANPKVKGDLCYGNKAVAKVVQLDRLPESAPVEEYNVRYLYKVDGLAEWAKRPEFQTTFPGPARIIADAEKKQITHAVKVTAEGLVARGLHNL